MAYGPQVDHGNAHEQHYVERDKPVEDGALHVVLVDGWREHYELTPLPVVGLEYVRDGAGLLVTVSLLEKHLRVLIPYVLHSRCIAGRYRAYDVLTAGDFARLGQRLARKIVGDERLGIVGERLVGGVVYLFYYCEIKADGPNGYDDSLEYGQPEGYYVLKLHRFFS